MTQTHFSCFSPFPQGALVFFVGAYWAAGVWIAHKCWLRPNVLLLLLVSFKKRSGKDIILKFEFILIFFCNIRWCILSPFIMRFYQIQRLHYTIRKVLCKQDIKTIRISRFKSNSSRLVVSGPNLFQMSRVTCKMRIKLKQYSKFSKFNLFSFLVLPSQIKCRNISGRIFKYFLVTKKKSFFKNLFC